MFVNNIINFHIHKKSRWSNISDTSSHIARLHEHDHGEDNILFIRVELWRVATSVSLLAFPLLAVISAKGCNLFMAGFPCAYSTSTYHKWLSWWWRWDSFAKDSRRGPATQSSMTEWWPCFASMPLEEHFSLQWNNPWYTDPVMVRGEDHSSRLQQQCLIYSITH